MKVYKRKTLELISGLALSNKKLPNVIKYIPSKTSVMKEEAPSLPRVIPEKVGISSSRVAMLLENLEAEMRTNIHSIMILKDGCVIAECSQNGYSPTRAHVSHSMSKTVTGMLIGILIDDGKISLTDTLRDHFTEYDIHPESMNITIEDLLKMSSGIPFSESGAVTDSRWTETFLADAPSFLHGTKFAYNSMNSYILMVIASRVISSEYGLSVKDFLNSRLFSPLGINEFFWEKGPEGIEKGGWGLYLSAESWAKLGIMMLSGGRFKDKRILSESWVSASTSTHNVTPSETGGFNYGYHLWVSREGQNFLFNGMLGQNLLVIPKNNIVVSVNSGNNELFQESPALSIIEKYLSCDSEALGRFPAFPTSLSKACRNFYSSRALVVPKEKKRGLAQFFGIRSRTPFDTAFSVLLSEFAFAENNHGILPLFVRVMQNNYQGGMVSLKFTREGENLRLTSLEGETEYSYKIGLYGYEYTDIEYNGEKYTVGAIASALTADKFRIEFIYPELANKRIIDLTLTGSRLTVEMAEMPNSKIADSFISTIPALSPKMSMAVGILESNLGKNFIQKTVSDLFSPTITAIDKKSPSFEEELEKENRIISEKLASLGIVRMLINNVTGAEIEKNKEKKPPSLGGMFISSLLGNLFSRKHDDEKQNNNDG